MTHGRTFLFQPGNFQIFSKKFTPTTVQAAGYRLQAQQVRHSFSLSSSFELFAPKIKISLCKSTKVETIE